MSPVRGPAARAAIIAAIATTVLGMAADAFAQAWIHKPGKGYAELGVRTLSGGAFYDNNGESVPIASQYTQTVLTTYGEVGVVERWLQLTAGGELYRRSKLDNQGATGGLGDLEIGAFTGLLQGDFPIKLSFGVSLGLPTGDDEPTSGLEDDFEADFIAASLPTGTGAFKLTPKVAAGIGFGGGKYPLSHYLSTSVGYVLWFGFEDSLQYAAEFGSRFINAPIIRFVTLRLRLTGLEPLSNTDVMSFSGVGEGVTYTSWGVGFAIDIYAGLGVFGMYESAFRAKSIISAIPYSAGVYWKF